MSSFVRYACVAGLLLAAILESTTALAVVPTAELTPLSVDFNDKTPGQSLGTRGAEFGEPDTLDSLDTLIIESSFGENFLQVSNDLSSLNARYLNWGFEDNAEISEGLVSVSVDFTPSVRDDYSIAVRESGGAAKDFVTLVFRQDGRLSAVDAAGLIGEYLNFYDGGDTLHIELLFDLDTGTSTLVINGTTLFAGRANGIQGRGVGSVLTGYLPTQNSNGSPFALDNFLVLANVPLPLVLDADFNNETPDDPIRADGANRGQPVYFSRGIEQQAILIRRNDLALRLWNTARGDAQFARWEFLKNLEFRRGIVAFEMDVRLQSLERYEISVNGPHDDSTLFTSIRFSPDRFITGGNTIEIVDSRGSTRIVGTYRSNVFQHLQLVFDMDAGTYTAKLDGHVLVANRPHSVTTGVGIASLQTGFQRKGVTGISMDIDNLQVGASDSPLTP